MSTLNGKCISPTESWDLPTVLLSLSNCPASELTSGLNAENKIPVIGEVGFTAPQKPQHLLAAVLLDHDFPIISKCS